MEYSNRQLKKSESEQTEIKYWKAILNVKNSLEKYLKELKELEKMFRFLK